MDQSEPLWFTAEQEADLATWRQKVKKHTLTTAFRQKRAGSPGFFWTGYWGKG
jgi:hypothetical protein